VAVAKYCLTLILASDLLVPRLLSLSLSLSLLLLLLLLLFFFFFSYLQTATVQFDHRVLAGASTASVLATLGLARFGAGGALWLALPGATRAALLGMGATLSAQVGLGVSTLLLYVPIELAAAHQLGSLVLLSCTTAAAHSLRAVPLGSPLAVGVAGVGSAVAAPAAAILATQGAAWPAASHAASHTASHAASHAASSPESIAK
jgi:hypothetical protein